MLKYWWMPEGTEVTWNDIHQRIYIGKLTPSLALSAKLGLANCEGKCTIPGLVALEVCGYSVGLWITYF